MEQIIFSGVWRHESASLYVLEHSFVIRKECSESGFLHAIHVIVILSPCWSLTGLTGMICHMLVQYFEVV